MRPADPSPLDAFIPAFDARERHAVTVRAPAHRVYEAARQFDLQSNALVRMIFALRAKVMGATPAPRKPLGFMEEMRSLGWGCLAERPGELFVAGATCQPWLADVTFTPVPPDRFRTYSEPGVVKIAWTIECRPEGPERTSLITETRAVATDEASRAMFLRYWRWARMGIIPIRWFLLPGIRRRAEAEQRRHRL